MTDHLKSYLAGVSERAAAATDGIWATMPYPSREAVVFIAKDERGPGKIIAASPGWADEEDITEDEELDNCRFIANAKQDIPKLVAIIASQAETIEIMESGTWSHHNQTELSFRVTRRALLEKIAQ